MVTCGVQVGSAVYRYFLFSTAAFSPEPLRHFQLPRDVAVAFDFFKVKPHWEELSGYFAEDLAKTPSLQTQRAKRRWCPLGRHIASPAVSLPVLPLSLCSRGAHILHHATMTFL